MNCGELADTGLGLPLLAALAFATACVLLGALLLATRARRGRTAVTVVLLLLVGSGAAFEAAPASATQAATLDCAPGHGADDSLTIVQTSTLRELAPSVPPAAITGSIVNNGADGTYITAIVVRIVAVTKAAGSPPGSCDASDYVLIDPRMAVGRALDPGGATGFAGASIGFNDKSVNQDACKGATISLQYDTA